MTPPAAGVDALPCSSQLPPCQSQAKPSSLAEHGLRLLFVPPLPPICPLSGAWSRVYTKVFHSSIHIPDTGHLAVRTMAAECSRAPNQGVAHTAELGCKICPSATTPPHLAAKCCATNPDIDPSPPVLHGGFVCGIPRAATCISAAAGTSKVSLGKINATISRSWICLG